MILSIFGGRVYKRFREIAHFFFKLACVAKCVLGMLLIKMLRKRFLSLPESDVYQTATNFRAI